MADETFNVMDSLLAAARRNGADAAEILWRETTARAASVRLGVVEAMERSETSETALRVFVGSRQALVATTGYRPSMAASMVARALAVARAAPEDPFCVLAPADAVVGESADLDLEEAREPSDATLLERAKALEDAARSVSGVTNSEGAQLEWTRERHAVLAGNGLKASYRRSEHGVFVSVLAGSGVAMERDYAYRSATHAADLGDLAQLGKKAGQGAVARLNPKKPSTRKVPVVYAPRVANSLLRHVANAVNGANLARGTSFLLDRFGSQLMSAGVNITDDAHRPRGLRSRPYDAEGLAGGAVAIVRDGVLEGRLLDLRSARRLHLPPGGNATRKPSTLPTAGASNFYLAAGRDSPQSLLKGMKEGLYVTELLGLSFNLENGDYSRGAAGFWIKDGALSWPVSEVTIAGNLVDMLRALVPADDLEFRYGYDAPTCRVDGMTVAGR